MKIKNTTQYNLRQVCLIHILVIIVLSIFWIWFCLPAVGKSFRRQHFLFWVNYPFKTHELGFSLFLFSLSCPSFWEELSIVLLCSFIPCGLLCVFYCVCVCLSHTAAFSVFCSHLFALAPSLQLLSFSPIAVSLLLSLSLLVCLDGDTCAHAFPLSLRHPLLNMCCLY